jgi:hypothetical protein
VQNAWRSLFTTGPWRSTPEWSRTWRYVAIPKAVAPASAWLATDAAGQWSICMSSTAAPLTSMKATVTPRMGLFGSMMTRWPVRATARS